MRIKMQKIHTIVQGQMRLGTTQQIKNLIMQLSYGRRSLLMRMICRR